MDKLPWINLGYDESNNGKYPEVCVLVASSNPEDIVLRKKEDKIPKWRRNHGAIKTRLAQVDHSFLFFDYNDRQRLFVPSIEVDYGFRKLGIIISSLVYGEPFGDHLNLFVDGNHYSQNERDYLKKVLQDTTSLPADCIEITYRGHLDQYMNIVNIADELAHCLLPDSTFAELRDSKHRKPLRLEECLMDVSV